MAFKSLRTDLLLFDIINIENVRIITCRENVHIMVLPVAETIEKQLMVVLRDRQKDLTEFLGIKMFLAPMSSVRGHKHCVFA